MNKPYAPFRLEEATIDGLHAAIKSGETTVKATVEHYIARARAFNGPASMLVTEGGRGGPEAVAPVGAHNPLRFPTKRVKASMVLPDMDKYKGPPIEYGRMEPTAS